MTDMQKSALLEAGNIGSGHAAIVLSQLMDRKIMIDIPSIEVFELSQLGKILGSQGKIFVQVSLEVLGGVRGVMIFVIEKDLAIALCDIIMGQEKGATKRLGELEESAIKEVGSIISASYLNAVNKMTAIALVISIPHYNIGKIEFLKNVLVEKGIKMKDTQECLCIETELIDNLTNIRSFLIFIPFDDAIDKIIKALGV